MTFLIDTVGELGATATMRIRKGEVLWLMLSSTQWSTVGPPATQSTLWLEESTNEGQTWQRLGTYQANVEAQRIKQAKEDSLVRLFASELGGAAVIWFSLIASAASAVPRWSAVQLTTSDLVLDAGDPPAAGTVIPAGLTFANADANIVHGIVRVPHDHFGDAVLYPVARWIKTGAGAGGPLWRMTYQLLNPNGTFAVVGPLSSGIFNPGNEAGIERLSMFQRMVLNADMQTIAFTLTRQAVPTDAIAIRAEVLQAAELAVTVNVGAAMTAQQFGGGIQGIYRDKALLEFSANPNDGDAFTIEVASTVYTFEILDAPTGAPAAGTFEIQRGGDAAATMADAITVIEAAVDALDINLGLEADVEGNDGYADDLELLGIDFIYTTDDRGSREMFRK